VVLMVSVWIRLAMGYYGGRLADCRWESISRQFHGAAETGMVCGLLLITDGNTVPRVAGRLNVMLMVQFAHRASCHK